jgi:hypothetical protein
MRLLSNPVLWREWLRIRRRWYLWIVFLLLAVALHFVYPGYLLRRGLGGAPAGWTVALLFSLANVFRVNLFLAIWLILASIGRERAGRGWESLASTPLTAREILVGKLVFPILFLTAVNLLSIAFDFNGFLSTLHDFGATGSTRLLYLLAVIGSTQLAGFFYACMACVIVMAAGWRREWGNAALLSLAVLVGLGILIHVFTSLLQAFLLSLGVFQAQSFWMFALISYSLPIALAEAAIAVWVFRRLEKRFRSALAAGGGEPVP